MSKFLEKAYIGARGVNTKGHKYTIIKRNSEHRRYYTIKFDSGYEVEVISSNLYRGTIVDRYQKTYRNWGILGDRVDIEDPHYKKIYLHWAHMITRCYHKKSKYYHNYGGIGVTVCPRWQRFDNFYHDFRKIDGYTEEIMELVSHRHLDKDLKQLDIPLGERVYSLNTCTLITREENDKMKREWKRPFIKATNPAGTVFCVNHTVDFLKSIKNIINSKYVHQCLNGEKDNHLGWKFSRITEQEYNSFHSKNPNTPKYPTEEDIIIIPTHRTNTSRPYIQIYDENIHTPRYNQTLIK